MTWSPDGSQLLLVVAGFGADIAGAQGGTRTVTKSNELPSWAPSIDTGDAENLWRVLYTFDMFSHHYRRLTPPGLNCWEATWLNTHTIITVVSNSHSEGSWYGSRLVAIDLDSGAQRDLYKPEYQLGLPVVSADGKRIALIEAPCSDRIIFVR